MSPPSLLIRADDGRIRVARFRTDHTGFRVWTHTVRPGRCRRCSCTDHASCVGGCWWVDGTHTLCSRCAARPPQQEPSA